VTDLLERYPSNPHAYEARYRLGELHHSQGEFEEALADYAKVEGDPGFELRARFGALQSQFELLKQADSPEARDRRLAAIGESLDRYWERARGFDAKKAGDQPLAEFSAKATLMQAVYTGLHKTDADAEVVSVLSDFEKKYPEQKELFPQAVRLRLGALRGLGKWQEAEALVTANAEALRQNTEADKIEALATSFAKAASSRQAKGDAEGSKAASRVALRLYELGGENDDSPDGKRLLGVAKLYESTNDLDGAARLYGKVLERNQSSLTAIGGLARVSELRKDFAAARGYWDRYTGLTRPGDAPWYRGQFEQARVSLAAGKRTESCDILTKLKPSMPGLSDQDLRKQLGELYDKACG
jgi:tetratricopeptide (TPR) repeat protein